MIHFSKLKLDLGASTLLPRWRGFIEPLYLPQDLLAGVTLSLVAIPLSLAIALASGVQPAVGLVTAVVAGIVCGFFGGNPISISGPAAAMAVMVSLIVEKYGLMGLALITLLCGFFQVMTGVLRLGRFVRLMPISVIEGFTAGIGAIILIGQLPRVLGLPPPSESHVIDVILHIKNLFQQSEMDSILVALGTIFLLWFLPKVSPKLPSPLIAIAIPSVSIYLLGIQGIEMVGEVPRSLPWPVLPGLPAGQNLLDLFNTSLLIYALASLQTLLSSTATDKLVKGQRSDLDQELIGQGLGNVATSLFGGIPISGVIVRSVTNVMAGAKTARASIVHSLVILLSIYVLAPWIARIPIAALAGMLLFISLRMMNPEKFLNFWKVSRADALIYTITFWTIVLVDLFEGVQWGLSAALLILVMQLGRTTFKLLGESNNASGPYRFELCGPMTFLSSLKIDELRAQIEHLDVKRGLVIDMSSVTEVDGSGAEMFLELLSEIDRLQMKVALFNLPQKEKEFLLSMNPDKSIRNVFAQTEQDLLRIFEGEVPRDPEIRLEKGVRKFLEERHRYTELFDKLSSGQTPHTLFITCSDSRIQPNLMTSTDPGELFIVRNVGNMVPIFSGAASFAVGAAVDFAVGVLGVEEIVVCGHSGCGAMKALHSHEPFPEKLKSLIAWRQATVDNKDYQSMPKAMEIDQVARINVLRQLDNLRTHPIVKEREEEGKLKLHAWFFEIKTGDIEIWSSQRKQYVKQSESA